MISGDEHEGMLLPRVVCGILTKNEEGTNLILIQRLVVVNGLRAYEGLDLG